MTTWMSALGTAYRTGVAGQTGWTWDERRAAYAVADAYYNNTAYARTSAGGYRDAQSALALGAGYFAYAATGSHRRFFASLNRPPEKRPLTKVQRLLRRLR